MSKLLIIHYKVIQFYTNINVDMLKDKIYRMLQKDMNAKNKSIQITLKIIQTCVLNNAEDEQCAQ